MTSTISVPQGLLTTLGSVTQLLERSYNAEEGLLRQKNELKNNIAYLQAEVTRVTGNHGTLLNNYEALASDLVEANKTLEAYDVEFEKLQGKVGRLEAEINDLYAEIEDKTDRLNRAEESAASLNQTVDLYAGRYAQTSLRAERAERELQQAQTVIEELREKVRKLEQPMFDFSEAPASYSFTFSTEEVDQEALKLFFGEPIGTVVANEDALQVGEFFD